MSDHGTEIWRYLHGEMDRDESRAFEQQMAGNRNLARDVEAARRLHGALKESLTVELTQEKLVEQTIALFDADMAREHRAQVESPPVKIFRFPNISEWLSLRPAYGLITAAAALFLLYLGYNNYTSEVLRLSDPVIYSKETRGERASADSEINQTLAPRIDAFMETIRDGYLEKQEPAGRSIFRRRTEWSMKIEAQPVFAGGIELTVQVKPIKVDLAGREFRFSTIDIQDMENNMDNWAETVTAHMAGQ